MDQDFRATATRLVGNGRGILAADESVATMNKRLEATRVAPTAEKRCAYREMLLTTPELAGSISGIILSDDVFTAQVSDGRPFPDACRQAGLLPGIKVDTGAKPLANAAGETVTEGLDDLRVRLESYASAGAAFTKWRAVIHVGEGLPSRRALVANAHALARYAALAQEAGLAPIVEPEVLMDGGHDLDRCEEVTQTVLHAVFEQLAEQGVVLEGMVLKPNMVLAGSDCARRAGIEEVAAATVRTLRCTVPAAVPGVAFLSGGQGVDQATAHLAAINALGPQPWELSFSFGRALVDQALQAWRGDPQCLDAGQEALAARARANADARAV
ncbi:MAG: fructose-bisphosphate aldolase class I [Candidatus Dormibacteraeota bacterium]|nr:fructose-bisphosphate aldolase class I [Candidatus Dormibacteraeota bacterium]